MMRFTRLASRAEMAMATARYVLPVPAGPMPNTISYFSMASRYRRWLTLFGCTVRRPNERCRPASANPQSRFGIGHQHTQHAVQVAVIEGESGALQLIVIGEDLLGASHISRCALEFDGIGFQIDGDLQTVF